MTLATSPRLRLTTLCALYLVQGIPTGFITIALAALLAAKGYTTGAIAQLLAVCWVPWAVKVVYAPLLDRFSHSRMGRRRPWLLIAQAGMLGSLSVLLLLPGPDGSLLPLGVTLFVYNLFGALQDVATDAMAVDLLTPAERGFTSGAMWSCKIVGIAIGGAGMGTLMSQWGWRPALTLQLSVLLLVMMVPLFIRERPTDRRWSLSKNTVPTLPLPAASAPDFRGVLRRLGVVLRQPSMLVLAGLALLGSVPTRMMVTFGPIFAVQSLGWTDAGYAQFAGGPALVAGAAGALLGGWLSDRFGRRLLIAAAALGIVAAFSVFALAQPWWQIPAVAVVFLGLGTFLDMALRMALQAVYMASAAPDVAATQFTIFMTLGNMSNVLGSVLLIPLAYWFEAQLIFMAAALLGVIPLFLLFKLPSIDTLQMHAAPPKAALLAPQPQEV